MGQQRGLKRADLTEVNALAQARELVSGAVGKTFRLEPDSSKGVPLREHHQRVQSRLFETRCHEQGQVKARAHFIGEETVGQADFLAFLLKTGWWVDIRDALALERCEDRGSHLQHALTAARLVA